MLRQGGGKRAGFTLPEVLVTVAIVSVLAAIVVPTVTNQIGKGDDTRFQTTVTNVRTGITAFVSDTRRFPRRVSHLYNAITGQNDLFGTPFAAAVAARWKGPYTSGALTLGDSLPLSIAFMQDSLIDSNLVAGTSGHVISSLSGVLTQAAAARLDTLLDSGNGNDAGILQWTPAAGAIAERAVKLQLMGSR
jgi:prepilin-type N-terminal cleavage/methylation domain-containing protein